MDKYLSILGSCVSRDAFNYCVDLPKINYIARQSLVTLFSHPFRDGRQLFPVITGDERKFELRNIEHDFNKDVFDCLPRDIPLIVDLIDERHELFELDNGAIYVNSVIASQHSNLASLARHKIHPLGSERMKLFRTALPQFVDELRKFDQVILHRAFFDPDYKGFWINSADFNMQLQVCYDYIERTVPGIISIELPRYLCRAAGGSPWGHAPMHYVIDYYIRFIYELERKLQWGLTITPWPKYPDSHLSG